MASLIFNSKSSNSFNNKLIMRSVNRQALPANQDNYLQIAGVDGSYLFPGKLQDRFIDVEFGFVFGPLEELRAVARAVAVWLRTTERSKLTFSDEPEVYYMAKVDGAIDWPQAIKSMKFTVKFRCLPYAYGEIGAFDEPYMYDTGLEYDVGLIYPNARLVQDTAFLAPYMVVPVGLPRLWAGFVWLYATHFSSQYNYGVETPLIVEITGSVVNPTITSANGESITITTALANQTLVIDGVAKTVKVDGVNVLHLKTGDWISMDVGDNKFTFTGLSPFAIVTYKWLNKLL
jgi:predicted phage tail component-like protein